MPASVAMNETTKTPAQIAKAAGSKAYHIIDSNFVAYDISQQALEAAFAAPLLPQVTEVTRYQIRTWLALNYGPTILTQIDAMLAAIEDDTQRALAQIAWEAATVIRLTDPLTIQFGAALGLTESQMADAFAVASKIGV
jgi:hypothetical protein